MNKNDEMSRVRISPAFSAAPITVAYEPVWAIGTGDTCAAEEADRVCGVIRATVGRLYGASAVDATDGDVSAALTWTSDRDGPIGSGPRITAVLSQGTALARLAGMHAGQVQKLSPSCWEQLGEALKGPVALRLSCEPKRLIFWLGELERLASGLGLRAAVVAQAGNGVLQCALQGEVSGAALDGTLLRPLRDGLAPEGGSLVVERAPAALKAELDVWGPIHPDVLAIMSRVKREFDPDGILNPGRFVGGL